MSNETRFDSIEDGIKAIASGEMVICVDDEDRENEGDLICAAEKITPEMVNFMAVHARGLICMPITADRANQLMLPPMVSDNESKSGTNFTISIEAAKGVTTGISAHERSHTILTAIAEGAKLVDAKGKEYHNAKMAFVEKVKTEVLTDAQRTAIGSKDKTPKIKKDKPAKDKKEDKNKA